MAYSHDLRVKAIEHLAKGHSKVDTSQVFGISIRTLFIWLNRQKKGYLAPSKTRQRKPYKIDGERLKSYISENPDRYLKEIAKVFGTTAMAISKACKRLKITIKKRPHSIKKEMKRREKSFKKN